MSEKTLLKMHQLNPEEMSMIRGGKEKPERPKSPDEIVVLL